MATVVLVGTVFYAGFAAWDEEHEALVKAEASADSPVVSFDIENSPRFIVRAPNPNRSFVAINIKTTKRLKCASAFITSIHPATDNDQAPPFGIDPIRSDQKLRIAWFDAGKEAYECRPVAKIDRIIPFNICDDGPTLQLLTDTDTAQQNTALANIKPGDYRITLQIDDETLPAGISQDFILHWTGESGGFFGQTF